MNTDTVLFLFKTQAIVKFQGWSPRFDETISIKEQDRFAPLGTYTTAFVSCGCELHLKGTSVQVFVGPSGWTSGEIEDRDHCQVGVRLNCGRMRWFHYHNAVDIEFPIHQAEQVADGEEEVRTKVKIISEEKVETKVFRTQCQEVEHWMERKCCQSASHGIELG